MFPFLKWLPNATSYGLLRSHLIFDHLLDFIVGFRLLCGHLVPSDLIGLHLINLLVAEGSVVFQPEHWPSLHAKSSTQVAELQWEVSLRVIVAYWVLGNWFSLILLGGGFCSVFWYVPGGV